MRRCAGSRRCSPRLQHGVTPAEVARAAYGPVHDDRKRGRRKGLDRDQRAHATESLAVAKAYVKHICGLMGFSRATLYAYVEEFSKQP